MIKISLAFPDDDKNFISAAARIQAFKLKLPDEIYKILASFGIKAQATSKKDYLSGPRPSKLMQKSSRLISSIATKMNRNEQNIEVSIGTNVEYAPVHEKGFTGTVSIPAFVRKVSSRNISGKIEGKRRILARGIGAVRAHTRKVNIKARPFLRPAVEDNLPWLKQNLFGLGGSYGK